MHPSLHAALEHGAWHYPDKTALSVDGEALTYAGLARAADEFAAALARHGLAAPTVALWLPNSHAWAAAFLGTSRSDGVAVPVSTRLTAAEMEYIVRHAGADVLVTTAGYRGRDHAAEAASRFAGGGDGPALVVAGSAGGTRWMSGVRRPAAPVPHPEGLLCVQYTSGTTAQPKGVMLSQANYLFAAHAVGRCQLLTPGSQFISAAPFFHCSGSLHALAVCLAAGCTLHTLSAWDAERCADTVYRHACDAGHGLFFPDLLELERATAWRQLASLRTAGGIGSATVLRRVHEELGIAGVAALYGMTETCGNHTMWFPDDPLEQRLLAHGRAHPGAAVRIVPDGAGAATGDEGEIQVRGPNVTRGYYRDEGATAALFTADGWLRTGDTGRLSPQGELTYLARSRELIRVGGENLAPLEVEEALVEATGAQGACVVGVPDARLAEVPVAVLVLGAAPVPHWDAALQRLRERLAGFKLPRSIYLAEELPLTSNRKLRRAEVRRWIADGTLRRVY
jgi:acyl-CoA synthetase (AMP-forming)/AMP-acid ligase II